MPCSRCSEKPNFHSFREIGKTSTGATIWYSRPYLGVEKRFTEDSIPNYLAHLDEASQKGQWIWIFDANGLDKLEVPNVLLMRKFYHLMVEKYGHCLKSIYMIHINWKVQFFFSLLYPFLSEETKRRLITCTSQIDLLSAGIPAELVKLTYNHSSS